MNCHPTLYKYLHAWAGDSDEVLLKNTQTCLYKALNTDPSEIMNIGWTSMATALNDPLISYHNFRRAYEQNSWAGEEHLRSRLQELIFPLDLNKPLGCYL